MENYRPGSARNRKNGLMKESDAGRGFVPLASPPAPTSAKAGKRRNRGRSKQAGNMRCFVLASPVVIYAVSGTLGRKSRQGRQRYESRRVTFWALMFIGAV